MKTHTNTKGYLLYECHGYKRRHECRYVKEKEPALKPMRRGSLLNFVREEDMRSDSSSSPMDPCISDLENKAAEHVEADVRVVILT